MPPVKVIFKLTYPVKYPDSFSVPIGIKVEASSTEILVIIAG
jgi:hypothetical protein